jgi:hypothetical protein
VYTKPTAPESIGAAVEGSFRLWLASLRRVWAFVFIPQLLSSLLAAMPRQSLATSLLSVGVGLISIAFYAALVARIDDVAAGGAAQGGMTFGGALARGFTRWPAALLALLMVMVVSAPLPVIGAWIAGDGAATPLPTDSPLQMVLFLAYALALLYLCGRAVVTLPVLVLQNRPAWASIRASWMLTRGQWWRCAALLGVLSLVTLALFLLANLLLEIVGIQSGFKLDGSLAGAPLMLLLEALSLLLGTLTGPLFLAGILVLYYDLNLRRADSAAADRGDESAVEER